MRIQCAILCALSLATWETQAADLGLSLTTSLVYEKGRCTTAAAPTLEIDFSAAQRLGEGEVYARFGLFSGAFVGECIGLKASAGYDFDLGGAWHPGLGAAAALDFGSRLVVRSGSDGIPASPMPYFGLEIDPLRFDIGDSTVSMVGAAISIAASQGPAIWRYGFDLLRLTHRFGNPDSHETDGQGKASPDRGADSGLRPSLKCTYGIGYNLFSSLPSRLSYLSFDAALEWRDVELCLGATSLADNPDRFADEWLTSISASYAPTIRAWNPAIGLGWLYADTGRELSGMNIYYLERSWVTSFYLSMKPLRFEVPIGRATEAVLSCLELRYSPLFPTRLERHGIPGTGIIGADLIRVGIGTGL